LDVLLAEQPSTKDGSGRETKPNHHLSGDDEAKARILKQKLVLLAKQTTVEKEARVE
jgi:hypothetical protein